MSETNGAKAPWPPRMRKSFSDLAHDAVELGELQVKLFKLDTCEAGRNVRTTAIMAAIGIALLLACLPVGLLAVAEGLVEHYQWSRTAALGAAAGGGLVLCCIFVGIALAKLKQGLNAWQRSSEELGRNVAWLKATLANDTHPTTSANRESTQTTSRSF